MSTLFNGDNSDSDQELKINLDYAKNYDTWRQKEELNKLKTKYGESALDAVTSQDPFSDSSSSDDDDDEVIQNPQFDKEFYKTLACLKKKDPCIYDEKIKFFNDMDKPEDNEIDQISKKKSKKKETLFLRDYERKIMIERNGQFSSSEDEDDAEQKVKMPTYVEEQQELKDSFKHALKNMDEGKDTCLLKIKQKTEDEKHKEEELYKEWLKGQKIEINLEEQKELEPLRDFWTDPNLDTNEKFLRDYILNNKYIDKELSSVNLDYDQIVHDSDENLSEDEKNIEKQEEFEHKYNFRFEEPDQDFIKRYPRTMENSMRKKDTRRAQKRASVKQRKEEEKQQKKEELKQLKALKRKEIEQKIEKLKEITGNNDMCFDNVDFDADFDPNEHDKKMKELFNEEYYGDDEDNVKPEFPDIDEELGIENTWDNYDPTVDEIDTEDAPQYKGPHCEDSDFNMDADYDESRALQSELVESTKKKKRRRRTEFATLIAKEKPKFDPKQFPSYEEYFDQYYSLDYEDMIGDLPCRFKYRKVVPNDYGLSVEEILMADDKELNKWCSLKRALQHKSEHIEMKEIQSYKQKSANEALKQKILKSLYTASDETKEKESLADESTVNAEQTDGNNKKRRRRKKKTKANNTDVECINTNTPSLPKKEVTDVAESSSKNNTRDNKNDKKEGKRMQKEDTRSQNRKQKRKNELTVDNDAPGLKKIKTNNTEKTVTQIKADVNKGKDNEKLVFNNKAAVIREKNKEKKKKENKKQFNKTKTGKHKSNSESVDAIMSLNAERLKMYGIKAKKLKNKLKYGNKKLPGH